MRILLSTIGSRGDVQPLVALAWQIHQLGHEAHLCVPPDFCEWIDDLGFSVTPIGPELRATAKPSAQAARPTAEQLRQMTEATVATQFETITRAARGCDVIVGATALQIAAPSIAESIGIPYVFASYCPAVLPSTHHAPPVYTIRGDDPSVASADFPRLWAQNAQRFNDSFGAALNLHRANIGLSPVHDVGNHIFTERPWLAADATLGPWPDSSDTNVFQTGAWILPDERPLDPEIESFLDEGDAPLYFGFGSIRAPDNLSEVVIKSARAHDKRVIISRGWADISLLDNATHCLSIGEVNQQALFKRVAAVVHHGGAGTTTAAARAGTPQLIIPQHYDQYYWAKRVQQLGVGGAHSPQMPTVESLTRTLEQVLQSDVTSRARELANQVSSDGARRAAQHLLAVA